MAFEAFDRTSALELATSTAETFSIGLKQLVATVEAELDAERALQKQERRRLEESVTNHLASCERLLAERTSVDEQRSNLQEEATTLMQLRETILRERQSLEDDKALFEADRRNWGTDVVTFNVSGTATVSVLRATLLQCEDSMLSAALSGRWSIPKDAEGHIFVDFPECIFLPLIEYMKLRSIEDPEHPVSPPTFASPEIEEQFHRMLSFYGLLEWVCRPETVDHSIAHGEHCYAVLPPHPPDDEVIGRDMQDKILVVPRGWELFSCDSEDFTAVIEDLTHRCWGTQVLCVENNNGSFDAYCTAVPSAVGGQPGSMFQSGVDWLEQVGVNGHRFRGLSGRLVIRARRRAVEDPSAQQLDADAALMHAGF